MKISTCRSTRRTAAGKATGTAAEMAVKMGARTALLTAVAAMALISAMLLTSCGSKAAQTATITLDSNPTTGYEWVVEQDDELFDIKSEYTENDHDEEMVGVGGSETITLTPKAAGTTTVNFYYKQPWDDESLDTRLTYNITVSDSMQITINSTTAELGGVISEMPEIPELVIK